MPISNLISAAKSEQFNIKQPLLREWTFTTKTIETSPQKSLLVARLIRKMSVQQAITQLEFNLKKSSNILKSTLLRGIFMLLLSSLLIKLLVRLNITQIIK